MSLSPLRIICLGLALALVGCATAPPPEADLGHRLLGTWILVAASVPGTPSGIGCRLKVFTQGQWLITQPDPKTGVVIYHHGGTYTLSGDELVQTTEYATSSTASYIHDVHRFRISVEGDTYRQVGLDNQFTETWKRVN